MSLFSDVEERYVQVPKEHVAHESERTRLYREWHLLPKARLLTDMRKICSPRGQRKQPDSSDTERIRRIVSEFGLSLDGLAKLLNLSDWQVVGEMQQRDCGPLHGKLMAWAWLCCFYGEEYEGLLLKPERKPAARVKRRQRASQKTKRATKR